MRLLLILLISLFVLACNSPEEQIQEDRQKNKDHRIKSIENLHYTKDPRTGFCYASYCLTYWGCYSTTISYVPCTPEVEKLLDK